MFDKDGSGFISNQEIKEILGFGKAISEEAVNEIIKQVDENGDGQISFEEFSSMMKKLQSWKDIIVWFELLDHFSINYFK